MRQALLANVRWLTTTHGLLSLVALLVLVSWGQSWTKSVKKWKVKNAPVTWYGPYEFMALDFLHNFQAANFWAKGHDPYREDFQDPIGRKLCYPPVVVLCFGWCALFSVKKAIAVWTIALAAFAAMGAVAAWRSRQSLGLAPVPILAAVAAIVTSAPVDFAMERGNYDLMLVPLVLLMAWGLRRTGWRADLVVGAALGLAVCLKVYPALLVFPLLVLRRYRSVGFTMVAGLAFLAFQFQNLPIFVQNLRDLAAITDEKFHNFSVLPATHSITFAWAPLWRETRFAYLTKIPGSVAAVGIVGSLLLWVGFHIRRCPNPRNVIVPFLLWTAAAATFVPRVSNDYNLFFLPMAALAVWDRRDSVLLHVALGLTCVWVQPLAFGLSLSVLVGLKVVSLVAVAACLVRRIREQSAEPGVPTVVLSATAVVSLPRPSPTTECCHVE